jgi:hypothetical protein
VSWRYGLTIPKVSDGTSKTFLFGEKHVRPEDYGKIVGGDISVYSDDFFEPSIRTAGFGIRPSDPPDTGVYPLAQSPHGDLGNSDRAAQFGGMHKGVCNFVLCDGSTRSVSVVIDNVALSRMADRADGQASTEP